ncbi:SDR family NAD(P)-dependent oxidoreductase [Streptomyces sp. NPDC006527]|uniref:SDR family NAD(P)-dependent oxidoreductase n=1 Tax=Streptomyces sp. NPDC006527 TaxID=3364749 RepID=UPI0036823ECA
MESRQDPPVWLVTGCPTGFGRSIAAHLLDEGFRVVVTARRTEQIKDLGARDNAFAVPLDVTDDDSVAHARWQAQEWGTEGPRIVSISPGVISTQLLHAMFAVRGAPPDHGARNVIEAATGPIPHSGAYLDDGRPARPNPQVEDPVFRDRLREVTSRLLADWL